MKDKLDIKADGSNADLHDTDNIDDTSECPLPTIESLYPLPRLRAQALGHLAGRGEMLRLAGRRWGHRGCLRRKGGYQHQCNKRGGT